MEQSEINAEIEELNEARDLWAQANAWGISFREVEAAVDKHEATVAEMRGFPLSSFERGSIRRNIVERMCAAAREKQARTPTSELPKDLQDRLEALKQRGNGPEA